LLKKIFAGADAIAGFTLLQQAVEVFAGANAIGGFTLLQQTGLFELFLCVPLQTSLLDFFSGRPVSGIIGSSEL
jgi:hypothetical protein